MKKRIVLIVSLVAGIVAALLTRVYISVKESEVADMKAKLRRQYGSMYVLCFKRDTPAGTKVTRDDFNERLVPELGMRGQAVTRDSIPDITGRKTVAAHNKNEVVFWSDIEGGDPRSKGLSADIKHQMRAVSVNVSGAASVTGMVRPSDHVDVIGTFDFDGNSGKKSVQLSRFGRQGAARRSRDVHYFAERPRPRSRPRDRKDARPFARDGWRIFDRYA